MKLLPSLARREANTEPEKAAPVLVWVPPGGKPVQCPNIHEAGLCATKLAGERPGMLVGVYELIGTAYVPISYPDVQAADRESEKLAAPAQEMGQP